MEEIEPKTSKEEEYYNKKLKIEEERIQDTVRRWKSLYGSYPEAFKVINDTLTDQIKYATDTMAVTTDSDVLLKYSGGLWALTQLQNMLLEQSDIT